MKITFKQNRLVFLANSENPSQPEKPIGETLGTNLRDFLGEKIKTFTNTKLNLAKTSELITNFQPQKKDSSKNFLQPETQDSSYKNPKVGDKFKVNFQRDIKAQKNIGAGDILPPQVSQISVLKNGNENKKRTGLRRTTPRNGFYDENSYIPILNGDTLIIESTNAVQPKPQTPEKLKPSTPEKRINTGLALAASKDSFDSELIATPEVIEKFKLAQEAAKAIGLKLHVFSSYRDTKRQRELWRDEVQSLREKYPKLSYEQIKKLAIKTVARPGKSNHQKGTALDIVAVPATYETCDTTTTEKLKRNRSMTRQLEKIMAQAGFARLKNEAWHFEVPSAEQLESESYRKTRNIPSNIDLTTQLNVSQNTAPQEQPKPLAPQSSKELSINASESPTDVPFYINFSPELKSKPPKYIVVLSGDGDDHKNTLAKFDVLKEVEELRNQGTNAILVIPDHNPNPNIGRKQKWDYLAGKVETMFSYCKQTTGAEASDIKLISFSGGYRAAKGILDSKYTDKISSVTMLDSTYEDSKYDTVSELANLVKKGIPITAVVSTQNGATNAGLKKLQATTGNSPLISVIKSGLPHEKAAISQFRPGLLAAIKAPETRSKT